MKSKIFTSAAGLCRFVNENKVNVFTITEGPGALGSPKYTLFYTELNEE